MADTSETQCHVEIFESLGFLDDCFRNGWTLFQSSAGQSFLNADDITGDYATMAVTEGVTPIGCGYRKDVSGKSLSTNTYPMIRIRLRGRGSAPQYKVDVEYTDATVTSSGWNDAPTAFDATNMELSTGKTIRYVKLYARSNTASGSAYLDYDYAVIPRNPPLIPHEFISMTADLRVTNAVSNLKLELFDDVLQGVTARRYSFDEQFGSKAYDLSPSKAIASLVNASWSSGGKHGGCVSFTDSSSSRLDTGYTCTVPATGAMTAAFWVKASPGASGVICGFGKAVGADWNRVQFNWSGNYIRLYVKDDSANVRQYTSVRVVADDQWHLIVGVIDPASDIVTLYIDGEMDGGSTGTLGSITLDAFDLTWGCLHSQAGYTNYTTALVDEAQVFTRALTEEEVTALYLRDPLSGAARAGPGSIVMVYLAAAGESLVYKLITARVIDRNANGDPDEPMVSLTCEDLGEVIHERTFTKEYALPRYISGVAEDIVTDSVPELDKAADTTDRTITNKFRDEGAWSLLQKMAESAHYATGESGAHFYVDPGGCLRFKKYGAFSCTHVISDGSDGNTPNILDISVEETMKGEPRLVNEAKIVTFEEENYPRDMDALTESVEGWSSPDPTDSGYPMSDTGDMVSGTASVHFNTMNPGTQYRMRLEFPDLDITGFDTIKFQMKYGAGLNVDSFEVRIWRGGWLWVTDYMEKTGISPQGSGAWREYTVGIPLMSKTGNPGNIIKNVRIRAVHSTQIGSGGFLVDKLRFVRDEKAGTASDSTSQEAYGKRTYRSVDKTITDLGYAGYLAGNIVEHRKNPLVTAKVVVPGRAQPGYRPPQIVTVTSLKDGFNGANFMIQGARHIYAVDEGYNCYLDLVAARKPDGSYEPKVVTVSLDLGQVMAIFRQTQTEVMMNALRSNWE